MGKIAFAFSGQGAQYSGMGKELCDRYETVKSLYDAAEKIRPGTQKQSFEGTADELKQTENTQPCLYLADLAAALALADEGVRADMCTGFSLGELAALAYAGAYSPIDGFSAVCKRGLLMAQAVTDEPTAMGAVLKLDSNTVCALCSEFEGLYPVNFNSAAQTVVSGLQKNMSEFEARVKAVGGRFVPLAVSGAFHSPYMDSAAEQFEKVLGEFALSVPEIPVYANYTAKPYRDVFGTLRLQMNHPVLFRQTIENMIADGADTFIEVGVGKTLYNLIKKISADVKVYNVENAESLTATVEAVRADT